MHFISAVSVSAIALASFAAAQSLGFTTVPTTVRAGQATTIEYDAPDLDESVIITLRKGDPNELDIIQILTTSATGGSYTWIPANSYENDDDYALQIQQGREINYSGAISLTGSDPAAVSAARAATASLASQGAAITSSFAQASSISSIQSVIASYNSSLQNLTGPRTTSLASISASATGTGSALPRNQTFVSPTGPSTSTEVATRTAGGQSTSTSTGPATSATPTGAAAHAIDAVSKSSPLALIFAVVVGLLL